MGDAPCNWSYAVSEDIYWRIIGGLGGDFFEAAERQKQS